MKRMLLAGVALAYTGALITSASAQGFDTSGWHTYVGADYQYLSANYKSGISTVLPDTLSSGMNVHLGERFGRYYAAEFGYMASDASRTVAITQMVGATPITTNYKSDVTISGPTLDLYGYLPLWHSDVSLFGTGGVSYLKGKAKITGDTLYASSSKTEFGWRFGGGIEWRPTPVFGIRAMGRYQSADFSGITNHIFIASLGMNFYF